jgi:hypothetical protein
VKTDARDRSEGASPYALPARPPREGVLNAEAQSILSLHSQQVLRGSPLMTGLTIGRLLPLTAAG